MIKAIKDFFRFIKDFVKYKFNKMKKSEKKQFKKVLKSFDNFTLWGKISRVVTGNIYLAVA